MSVGFSDPGTSFHSVIVLLSRIPCSLFITKTGNFLLVLRIYFIIICESLHNLTVETGNSSWSKIADLRRASKTPACSSSLGTVNVARFIDANLKLNITNEQTGLFLSILMHFKYATAPYAIVDASQKTCNSTSLLLSLWKANHLFNNILVCSLNLVFIHFTVLTIDVVWSHSNVLYLSVILEWFSLVSVKPV